MGVTPIGSPNGIRTYFYSVSNAEYTGRVEVFDLTDLTEPIGDEKKPQVTNIKHGSTKVKYTDNKYYPIKWVDLNFTANPDSTLPTLQSQAIQVNNAVTDDAHDKTNKTQIRIASLTNNYVCLEAVSTLDYASVSFSYGFRFDNRKESYNSKLDFRLAAQSSLPFNNVGIITFKYSDDSGDYYAFHMIKTDAPNFTTTLRLSCLTDYPGILPDIKKDDDSYGKYSGGGSGYGGGGFDDSSDSFGLPEVPSLGISEIGFINVYNPSVKQLTGLADDLFPDIVLPQPSQLEGIEAVAENLANTCDTIGKFAETFINQNLINYVIDCHIVPVSPVSTNNTGIKIGFKTFNYNPNKVLSDYVIYNCGTLEIGEYYHNFLDYVGTRAKLYLPFIGFVNVNPEWFIGGRLQVKYHFNVIDGSCIAFVIGTSSKSKLLDTVVATFGGNCCVHIPITGVNYSSMISGVVSGASQIVSGIASGNVGSVASGALGILDAHPDLQQSNSYNSGMSYMCYRKPYLLIERPVADFSQNYPSEKGLPLNATYPLNALRGFTQCDDVNFNVNFTCTEEEKTMIKEALKEGIIL